jgi:hypothetical protein
MAVPVVWLILLIDLRIIYCQANTFIHMVLQNSLWTQDLELGHLHP